MISSSEFVLRLLREIAGKSDTAALGRWWVHKFADGFEDADDSLVVGLEVAFELIGLLGWPRPGCKITNCDLKRSASSPVSWNMRSLGKRSPLRLIAWLSVRVSDLDTFAPDRAGGIERVLRPGCRYQSPARRRGARLGDAQNAGRRPESAGAERHSDDPQCSATGEELCFSGHAELEGAARTSPRRM